MPQAIVAAAVMVGAEYVGAVAFGSVLAANFAWGSAFAKAAFVALASEVLSSPRANQSPMIAEVQNRKQLVRASAEPRRAVYGQVQVSGTLLYASNGTDINYVHLVVALAGHSSHAIGDIWLGDELLGALDGSGNCTTGRFADHVRVKKYLGITSQVMDADLAAECPEWGAKNRPLKGITYVYLRIKRSRDVFPNGLPTPRFMLTGKNDILDPRTGLTGYHDNAALCTLDYILWKHGIGSTLDEVVQSTWIAAANACDEVVALPGGGTQKRYTINGSFTLDRIPVDVLDEMRSAMAGCASYSMGVWEGHAGVASSPVMDLSEADLRGPYKVRMRPSRAQLYNAVKGTYISAADRWVETDFPPVTNATYEAQDGGERIYKDVKLPFCIDPYAAQRIAKTDLERHRQGIVVDYPARIIGLKLQIWNVVRLNIAAMGWTNKPFRVVDKKMSLFGGADLVLEEYSSSIYTWSSLEATLVDPAPDTSLPNPFTCGSPGNLAVGEALYETRGGGGVKAKALVSCLAATDVFVRQYQLEYKLASASAWTVLPAQTATSWEINDIAPGVYNWRVRGINAIGVQSDYTPANREIFGLSARPADLSGLVVQSVSALDVLSWTLSPDLDVRVGGKVLIRHSPALSGATWESSTSACESQPGGATSKVLPLRAGTYFIKAEDSSGLQSLNAASFASNGSSLFTYTTLGTVQEAPTFPGTFVNTYHDSDVGSVIELIGSALFDDGLDFDTGTMFDYAGGIVPAGYYNFNSGIDLGSVQKVRLTATLSALAENVLAYFDEGVNFDAGLDFDKTSGAPVDAWVEVRSTNDNPSGTPTWGAWQRLTAADFTHRAFLFRAALTSADPIYNIAIDQLRIKAEAL